MKNSKSAWLALFCLALIVFLGKGYESTLPATDSSGVAALSLSATAHGLIPQLPIGTEIESPVWGSHGFNDYPATFFYVNGWIMRALGPSAFSFKLLPGLFSAGCVVLTALLGAALATPLTGFFAGLILLFTRDFVIDGVNGHLDTITAFFILVSFLAFEKKHLWIAALAAGLGMWFKSPVALLIVPAGFALRPREWKKWLAPSALAIFVGLSVWALEGAIGGWDLVRDYWVRQVFGTAVQGRGAPTSYDPFQFFRILRGHYMPWTLLFLWSLGSIARKRRWKNKEFRIPLTAAGILVVVISLIRFKYDHYFVPAFPFLAILGAQPLAKLARRREEGFYRGLAAATLALATYLVCTPTALSPESFPALKRFMALIQSYGKCSDRVLFVEGGQVYGGYVDYAPLINFYTGHNVFQASCTNAELMASRPDVGWVIIAAGNLANCLSDGVQERFDMRWLSGNLYLLSRVVPKGAEDSLSPLDRELAAAVDCQPAPLPHDRYHAY